MSDSRAADNHIVANEPQGPNPTVPAQGTQEANTGSGEKPDEGFAHLENSETNVSNGNVDPQEKAADVVPNINHVASLGLENTEQLEKKIVRRLDMTLLPQLWILYMFNYLNRVNIAQARLNTFDEDLGLQDGDYQVRCFARRVLSTQSI